MPERSKRGRKKKFRRRSSVKSKEFFVRERSGRHHCAVCGAVLHGVPHGKKANEVRAMSKSERRPTALFAGVLCSKCRAIVVEEAAKLQAKVKKEGKVELRLRKYVAGVKVS